MVHQYKEWYTPIHNHKNNKYCLPFQSNIIACKYDVLSPIQITAKTLWLLAHQYIEWHTLVHKYKNNKYCLLLSKAILLQANMMFVPLFTKVVDKYLRILCSTGSYWENIFALWQKFDITVYHFDTLPLSTHTPLRILHHFLVKTKDPRNFA